MRRNRYNILICIASVWLAATVLADGTVVWTPDTGKVNVEELPRNDPVQRFAYARAMATAGQYSDAIRELRAIVEKYPDEIFVEQAEQAIIVCLWQSGKHRRAYRACWTFLKNYPLSVLASNVEDMRLQIAVDLSYEDPKAALVLLNELLQTSRFEEQSADCLRYIGDCHFRRKQYEEARDHYLELLEDYPKSRWVTYAYFRMGLCDYRHGFRQMRDLGLIRRAMDEFRDYMAEYADISVVVSKQRVAEYLGNLERFDAEHYLAVANFYETKRNKPEAAAIYLQRLITLYPDSVPGRQARLRLEQLKEKYVLRPEQVVRKVAF